MSWPTLQPPGNDEIDVHPLDSLKSLSIKLISDRFGEFSIFPRTMEYGIDILNNLTITESILTPLVTGTLIVHDVGNFIENLNIQGFEDLELKYKKAGNEVVFRGIIVDVNLLTNDAVLSEKMNSVQKLRAYSMSFMNKDLFLANFKNIQEIPEPKNPNQSAQNDEPKFTNKDFIGWISKLNT
jgi:hypothetical protein